MLYQSSFYDALAEHNKELAEKIQEMLSEINSHNISYDEMYGYEQALTEVLNLIEGK